MGRRVKKERTLLEKQRMRGTKIARSEINREIDWGKKGIERKIKKER